MDIYLILEHGRRVKRFTCDALSLDVNFLGTGFKANNSICATKCVILLYTGGYCDNQGECICRQKIKDYLKNKLSFLG